jgi:hypothetical protein
MLVTPPPIVEAWRLLHYLNVETRLLSLSLIVEAWPLPLSLFVEAWPLVLSCTVKSCPLLFTKFCKGLATGLYYTVESWPLHAWQLQLYCYSPIL